MNEVLNNPMVIDIVNKTGVTLDAGLAECVRYTMLSGILSIIGGSILLVPSVISLYWTGRMGYKTWGEYSTPPYSLFAFVSFLSVICALIFISNGAIQYLCPIGYMIQEAIK